ncbi:MAG TPA: DUF3570 domain-containing protein [Polyangia bacterium]
MAFVTMLVALAPSYQIESVRVRFTHYDQKGIGYQSAAGPAGQPGSEQETVEQPQAEVVARIGDQVTERIWIPIDVITAASPDHSIYGMPVGTQPPDAITTASRRNTAGTFDTLTTYRWDRATELSFRAAFHIEEPFESWSYGLGATRAFAEDNTVVGASVNQIVDWFDRFHLDGGRDGRVNRSTTNLNVTVTQVLSPYTVAVLSYGGTLQVGTLGNTWSSVLLADGTRGEEKLPRQRLRHALALRVAEWLPWNAALKVYYRAYLDDWSAYAHTVETNLIQRVWKGLHLRGEYRIHWQSAVRFFTTAADPAGLGYRTSDSDLANFVAQTVGGTISWDFELAGRLRDVHLDVGYEHYFRSNNLTVDIATCGFGLLF